MASSYTSASPYLPVLDLHSNRIFNLFSTQKILANARRAEQGVIPRDPMRESIALELDFINILNDDGTFNADAGEQFKVS